MLKKINGLTIQPFNDLDKIWYSFIKEQISLTGYGSLEMRLTIKNGEVVALKVSRESTLNINNLTS